MEFSGFIDMFYIKRGNSYFSKYDLVEIGFAINDAKYLSSEELHDSYNLFLSNRNEWLDKYAWDDDDVFLQAKMISWLKPFIL
jgi:hypothetical protein